MSDTTNMNDSDAEEGTEADTEAGEAPGNTGAPDPVAAAILEQLAAVKPGGSIAPEAVARAVAEGRRKANDRPDLWRRYLSAVKQQAIHLARAGEIQVLRKGKPVEDPARAKGVVRYRLPG